MSTQEPTIPVLQQTATTSEFADTDSPQLKPLAKGLYETTSTDPLDATSDATVVPLHSHHDDIPAKYTSQYPNNDTTPTTHEQLGKDLSNVSLGFHYPLSVILRTNLCGIADRELVQSRLA